MSTPQRGAYEEVPPDPAATIESLRSLGYSPRTALADLIDNSLAAGAMCIDVRLHWAGGNSWCAVVDDGVGMTEPQLRQAMKIGSRDPLLERGPGDLGRFGLGLKTASFSQCRELTVQTRTGKAGAPQVRSWDIDHVREVGRWDLRLSAPDSARSLLSELDSGSAGTVVLWRRLTELAEDGVAPQDTEARRRFHEQIDLVDRHVAMTYGRILVRKSSPPRIRLNGRLVSAWDPFLTEVPSTQQLPTERLLLRGKSVVIRPFVLPHKSKLTDRAYEQAAGPLGWDAQQGFYVYRRDRLIVAGDWLGLRYLTRDAAHILARIAIDVPASLDHAWSLDVTKGTVRPPGPLSEDLKRIAKDTRRRARAVLHHRGVSVGRRRPRGVVPVWQQRRRHGELIFRLNRDHPLIVDLLTRLGPHRRDMTAVFDLIEETIPVLALPAGGEVPGRVAFEGRPPDEIVLLATRLYETLLQQGLTRQEATDRLLLCEPFNDYPDLIRTILD